MTQNHAFTLYPAIDVLGGACVRLCKGDYASKTEYSQNPRQVAERWLMDGAKWLHVVDLDGAKSGKSVNEETIAQIVEVAQQFGASVQVGGGIRTHAAIARWLHVGVTRCVLGTAASDIGWMTNAVQQFGPDQLIVGLDGRQGKLAVNGWLEQTDISLVDLGRQLQQCGVYHALVTDVERDGTQSGANLELSLQVQTDAQLAVVASGGIRHLQDVLQAQSIGLHGAIVGRALYDGTLNLHEAICALKGDAAC